MESQDRETEAKFYVRDLAKFGPRLERLGARLVQERAAETNLRFDTPAGDLARQGSVLRLRQDRSAHLTFKRDSQPAGGALTRTEIEVTVGDFERARRLIEALGYQVVFIYEKRRTAYRMDRSLVMLDELPFGSFVEIEGELEDLAPLAGRLGLAWQDAIPASYHALFKSVCRVRALAFRDLSFENFKGLEIAAEDLGIRPAD